MSSLVVTARYPSVTGGLDLCDGPYDIPQHRLCHDLDTVVKNDFHNPRLCEFPLLVQSFARLHDTSSKSFHTQFPVADANRIRGLRFHFSLL